MSDDWKIVQAAIDEDRKMRYPGVRDGLYPLTALKPFRRLGAGVPMLRHSRSSSDNSFNNRCDTDAVFLIRLLRSCAMLAGFDMKKHGFCMAGGAVCALLMGEDYAMGDIIIKDFDLFLVGHASDADARAAIKALHDHLFAYYAEHTAHDNLLRRVYRTKGCITFWNNKHEYLPVQVVLRRYSTPAEVVHGFDLGSSAFLWDGERVWMTALGRLALDHGANVLNLSARRASLEARITKYFVRGFDLILPGFAACACTELYRIQLPYLSVWRGRDRHPEQTTLCAYECSCSITAIRTWSARPGYDQHSNRAVSKDDMHIDDDTVVSDTIRRSSELDSSDYSHGIPYASLRSITLMNAYILGGDGEMNLAGLCGYAKDKPNLDLFEIQPTLDAEELVAAAEDAVGIDPHTRDATVYLKATLAVDRLKKMFGLEAMPLVVRYFETGQRPNRADIAQLAQKRILKLNERARIPFEFMGVEHNTALTGPFPRQVVTPYKWYGPTAWGPARDWRAMGSGAALCLAASGLVTTYPILWILQWTYPSLYVINERWLVKTIEKIVSQYQASAKEL